MAHILNTNFASVFTSENHDTFPVRPTPPIDITPLEIDKKSKITKINLKSTSQQDQITIIEVTERTATANS